MFPTLLVYFSKLSVEAKVEKNCVKCTLSVLFSLINFVLLSAIVQQPSPNRREDRPVSFYQIGANAGQPCVASLARDAANIAKDKQRNFLPSLIQNDTYGAVLNNITPPSSAGPGPAPAPPLPPRNIGKGRKTKQNVGKFSLLSYNRITYKCFVESLTIHFFAFILRNLAQVKQNVHIG